MQYQKFTQKELQIISSLVNATLGIPMTTQISRTDLLSLMNKLNENKIQADLVVGGIVTIQESVKLLPKEKAEDFAEKLRDPASQETNILSQTLKGCIKGLTEYVEQR